MSPTDASDTGQQRASLVSQDPLDSRLRALEGAFSFARGIAAAVGFLLSVGLGTVGAGAMASRDATLAQGARLTALEGRASSADSTQGRRDDVDRASRDTAIEIRADVRALRLQVDDLSQRFQRAEDNRPAGGRR
jgi:hypothetical protein